MLRILSGILRPRRTPGNATIHFVPHEVTGDADGIELVTIGEAGDFNEPPGRIVSLRFFTVRDRNLDRGPKGIITENVQVEDNPPSTRRMVVRWSATNGAEIQEISYMIIGEA